MRDYQDSIQQEGSVVRKSEKEKIPAPMNIHQAEMNGAKMGLHLSRSTAAVTLSKSAAFGSAVTKNSLLNLQKQQGNHYVQRVVDLSRQAEAEANTAQMSRTIQTKLTVGRPGDIYEQEADRTAQAFTAWEQRGSPTQDSAANVRRVMPEEEKKKEELTVRSKPQDELLSRQPEEEKKKEEMHAVQAKFDGTNIQRQEGEEEEG
jgi:hypothetical protein